MNGRRNDQQREKKGAVYEWRKKIEMYAVFEATMMIDVEDGYLIYKIDSGDAAAAPWKRIPWKRQVKKFGQPIKTLKLADYPMCMSIFSVGSKLYFCGGFQIDPITRGFVYSCKAYMLNLASKEGDIVSIEPMNFPKPVPFVFGPVNKYQFYVFSASEREKGYGNTKYTNPSLKILDTRTDKWESLIVPSYLTGLRFEVSSTLCGSNILLVCNPTTLSVFCTISKIWRVVEADLPFNQAFYLFTVKNIGHILLGLTYGFSLRELYLCEELNDVDLVGPFKPLGMIDSLNLKKVKPEFIGRWGEGSMACFYYFDCCKSICIVRSRKHELEPSYVPPVEPGLVNYEHFVIDIYDVYYGGLDGTEVKVKVENTLQYKYESKILMKPRHFFAVG